MCRAIFVGIRDYFVWAHRFELYSDKLDDNRC